MKKTTIFFSKKIQHFLPKMSKKQNKKNIQQKTVIIYIIIINNKLKNKS